MRNYKILNRPMFNRNNSAYGRGIASNLVTEEERIRFNAGGRVGLKWGSELAMKIPGVAKIVSKFTSKIPKSGATSPLQEANKLFKTPGSTGYGGTGWGATEYPWFKSIAGKGAGLATGVAGKMKRSPVLWGVPAGVGATGYLWNKLFGKEEELPKKKKDGKWKERLQTEAPKAEEEVEKGLYSPKEKKEKKSQMALAIAERLIGGSRDKWGSKAQMENIAGGLKDIREIADPSERREMMAKYKAWYGGQEKLDKAKYERQTSYKAAIAAGANHQEALKATSGITGTLNRSADPEQQEKDDDVIRERGPGTVFFDEEANSWKIFTPDGPVEVTVTQIEEAYKSGDIDKMRNPEKPKKKEEDLIAETETLDIDNPVTLAGTKPIIDTSEPKVYATGMPFFN